ncbi:MAG TPA: hypothetical protein VF708_06395 [Pyrinomonadaceae bacterium]|jgi:glycerol-3-phosphate O-acyltransferase
MNGFAGSKIKSVDAHSADFSWSPEEYRALFERIEREAQAAEEEARKQAHARAWELAKQQGVKPIRNMDKLKGDFWPEEESIDDFLSWLRDLRQNDNPRSIPE